MNTQIREETDWPQRSWALAIAGAIVAFCIYLLTDTGASSVSSGRSALAAFLMAAGIASAFTVEHGKIASSLAFASITATAQFGIRILQLGELADCLCLCLGRDCRAFVSGLEGRGFTLAGPPAHARLSDRP
jgi:hypothetical protein